MRTNWHTITTMIRNAEADLPSAQRAIALGRLRALRSLYETSVYARFSLPGEEDTQLSLSQASVTCRELRKLGHDVKKLRAQIKEARLVPLDLTTA
jgi:hypothetical protein